MRPSTTADGSYMFHHARISKAKGGLRLTFPTHLRAWLPCVHSLNLRSIYSHVSGTHPVNTL